MTLPTQETQPSELAQAISEAIDSTTNHAELIDRVIAEHATICCSYCGGNSYKGLAVVDGQWSDECREAMADHILTCPERPEKKLLEKIEELEARTFPSESNIKAVQGIVTCAQAVLTALNVGDVQSGSKLHLKLREVMILYRDKARSIAPKETK